MTIQRLILWMHKNAFATDKPPSFPWKAFMPLVACVMAFLVAPLPGQDESAAPASPAPDNSAAPGPDMAAPDANTATGPITDAAASAQDDTVTFQTFYDALASLGTWIQSPITAMSGSRR